MNKGERYRKDPVVKVLKETDGEATPTSPMVADHPKELLNDATSLGDAKPFGTAPTWTRHVDFALTQLLDS